MPTKTEVAAAIAEFGHLIRPEIWKVTGAGIPPMTNECGELLRSDGRIPGKNRSGLDWSDACGLYYFADASDSVLYVGQTIESCFGGRVRDHGSKYRQGDLKWLQVHDLTLVGFDQHCFLVLALERFLLDKFDFPLNRRR